MARRHSHDSSASSAALLGFVLLATPLACGSGSDDGAEDEATEQAEPPSSRPAPPRNEPPVAREPEPPAEEEPSATAAPSEQDDPPSETPAAPGASAGNQTSLPPAPATEFASCTLSEGSYGTNCDYIYVTMTQTSPERCAQLTIDNCGDGYRRPGLSVDTPLTWQLSSAAIGTSPDECELGVFNPQSSIVLEASGAIRWDAIESTNELPTGIVVDVTLQPSRTAEDPSSIDVVTSAPLNPARCDD